MDFMRFILKIYGCWVFTFLALFEIGGGHKLSISHYLSRVERAILPEATGRDAKD
jgi:hypothetical protein